MLKMKFVPSVPDRLWAQAVGETLLEAAKSQDWQKSVDSLAVRVLEELQGILDDPALDDCGCFARMEEILAAWNRAGLRSIRHWEAE